MYILGRATTIFASSNRPVVFLLFGKFSANNHFRLWPYTRSSAFRFLTLIHGLTIPRVLHEIVLGNTSDLVGFLSPFANSEVRIKQTGTAVDNPDIQSHKVEIPLEHILVQAEDHLIITKFRTRLSRTQSIKHKIEGLTVEHTRLPRLFRVNKRQREHALKSSLSPR